MRLSLAVGLLALTACAHASFDLVMVADTSNKCIHRFDGDTGVYLGSFGGGTLFSISAFVVNSTTGRAYVADQTIAAIRVFNYNTGAYEGDFGLSSGTNQSMGLSAAGNLVFGYSATGNHYTPAGIYSGGTSMQDVAGSLGIAMGSVAHSSGKQFYYTNAYASNASAIQIAATGIPGLTAYKSSELLTMGTWSSNSQIAMRGNNGAWVTNASNNLVYFSTQTAATSVSFGATSSISSFAANTLTGVGFGHGNNLFFAGRNSANTSGIIQRGYMGSSAMSGSFGSGIIGTPGQIQVVIAPEPGTWAALGLGSLMLIRRRRRSVK